MASALGQAQPTHQTDAHIAAKRAKHKTQYKDQAGPVNAVLRKPDVIPPSTVPPPCQPKPKAEEKETRYKRLARWFSSDRIIAIATVIYTFVSFLMFRAIRQQACVSAKILILAQRPRLRVRNIVVEHGLSEERGTPIRGQFYVSNVGGTDAHVLESYCRAFIVFGHLLPMKRPYEGEDGNNPVVIPPGTSSVRVRPGEAETAIFPLPGDEETASAAHPDRTVILTRDQYNGVFPKNDIELRVVNASRHTLYVLGWIRYCDKLGIIRRTAFCRRYDPVRGRFFAVHDRDYEHEE